jgi:hypothetical protein
MIKYFNAISLYSWKMTEEQVSKFEENIGKLEWKPIFTIQISFSILMSIFAYLMLKNLELDGELGGTIYLILSTIINSLLGILFVFGGYYFTKLFFKTKLTVIQFYTVILYLGLPIIMGYTIIGFISYILSTISLTYVAFSSILYLPLLYYLIKELTTSLFIFKTEFNTTEWKLFGVVLLWSIITSVFNNIFNKLLL